MSGAKIVIDLTGEKAEKLEELLTERADCGPSDEGWSPQEMESLAEKIYLAMKGANKQQDNGKG